MRQNVFILGATGKVGRRELVGQIAEKDLPGLKKHDNPTVVVGMADSRNIVLCEGGFSGEALAYFSKTRQRISEVSGIHMDGVDVWEEAQSAMQDMGFKHDVVYVDVTAAMQQARDFHLRVIREGGHIVTANKNPLARFDMQTYEELTSDPGRYRYSATTMAGLGAVPWISECDIIDDKIKNITASLSGTVGYITDRLTQGEKLSDAIRSAQEKGYTEPDFRDDLNGLDVARKLVILAREARHAVSMEDVEIKPFLPQRYFEIQDPDDCLAEIEASLDTEIGKMYQEAQNQGNTYKYLANFNTGDHKKPILKIDLQKVPITSPFGSLSGTENRIEITTDHYPETGPYKLQGPGAGLRVTAGVVRKDLWRMQKSTNRITLR